VTPLSWFPELVPPWGAFTASGLRGILGRPKQDPLTILVRETAQNSWDARLPDAQVRFSIDGVQFGQQQLKRLRSDVFAEAPPSGLPLPDRLATGDLWALIVRDTNTYGLGGPTRADETKQGEANRYARFLLDIGVAERAEVEGGTYGFGRSIAYNISGVQTVLVYTRTQDQLPHLESRFIATALGEQYTLNGKRFTGRHWWGRLTRGSVEPVVGGEADALAAAVGFKPFQRDETGTALMILDPLLRTSDPGRAMAFIAETMTWHLWPKMVPVRGRNPMLFSVGWNGTKIPVPNPANLPPLPGYVRALEVLRSADGPTTTADGVEVIEIRSTRPKTVLGLLAVSRFPFRSRHPTATLGDDSNEDSPYTGASPFEGNSFHVVLLRKPELVVSYNRYTALPDTNLEWAGVFLAAAGHNEAFAFSEPPTHDSWEPRSIEDRSQRRIVNIALREIRSAVNSRYQPVSPATSAAGGQSVARIANALGPLFLGIPGGGTGVFAGGGGSPGAGGASRRPRVQITKFGPAMEGGERVSEVRFSVTPAVGSAETSVHVVVDVATGDGSTVEGTDRPIGADVPMLLEVEGPQSVTGVRGYSRTVFSAHGAGESAWRVLATAPDGMLVSFSIDAEAVSGAGGR
jgi:hypothetical protein